MLFRRPRPVHGYPMSPFPDDNRSASAEIDDEDPIKVVVRSMPSNAAATSQRTDYNDSWLVCKCVLN